MLRVNRIVNHPSYNPSKSKVADDIAMIQLDQEAEWNDLVQPSCLPNPDKDSYTGMMATVAGWGLTNEIQNGKSYMDIFWDIVKIFEKTRLSSAYLCYIIYSPKNNKTKGGQRPNALQKVDLPIIENKVCQDWYREEKKPLTIVDTSMCAGFEQGGKDSCQVKDSTYFFKQ
jgi:hypothetical protein